MDPNRIAAERSAALVHGQRFMFHDGTVQPQESGAETPSASGSVSEHDRGRVADATEAQLVNIAHAAAYRAWQLSNVAIMISQGIPVRDDYARVQPLANAVVDSALVNARGLAWFLAGDGDASFRLFEPEWDHSVCKVASKVPSPVSMHLGHVTKGAPDGEKHPGAWPLRELAVVLCGGLASLVEALGERDRVLFVPVVDVSYRELLVQEVLTPPTPVSENPRVATLTRALRRHLVAIELLDASDLAQTDSHGP